MGHIKSLLAVCLVHAAKMHSVSRHEGNEDNPDDNTPMVLSFFQALYFLSVKSMIHGGTCRRQEYVLWLHFLKTCTDLATDDNGLKTS